MDLLNCKNWFDYFQISDFEDIKQKVYEITLKENVAPNEENILAAFDNTPLDKVKVVIVGQDPYPTRGVANGLSFSTSPNNKIPQSIKNIYKELNAEMGCFIPNNADLTPWTKQGVLLLNKALTVEIGNPKSHIKLWKEFTDDILKLLNLQDRPIVYILWGNDAQKLAKFLDNPKQLVIKCTHPSPLSASRGFFGSNVFNKTNEFLVNNNIDAIDWQIPNI